MVIEWFLNITGGDMIAVGRKYKDDWVGRLNCQLLVVTNLPPVFGDAAGAIAARIVPMKFRRSFAGVENSELKKQLRQETSAIAIWMLLGYRRLKRRGFMFTADAGSEEIRQNVIELSAPIKQFAQDKLVLHESFHAPMGTVYDAWTRWCDAEGRKPGPASHFSRDLLAAFEQVSRGERVYGARRRRAYLGLRLRTNDDDAAAVMNGELMAVMANSAGVASSDAATESVDADDDDPFADEGDDDDDGA